MLSYFVHVQGHREDYPAKRGEQPQRKRDCFGGNVQEKVEKIGIAIRGLRNPRDRYTLCEKIKSNKGTDGKLAMMCVDS